MHCELPGGTCRSRKLLTWQTSSLLSVMLRVLMYVVLQDSQALQVSMRTLSDCELAVAVYPTFSYNSIGGGGLASATQEGSVVHIQFDPSTLKIPDVNFRNTTFMGVPMAPPFSIAVKPKKLEVCPRPGIVLKTEHYCWTFGRPDSASAAAAAILLASRHGG